MRVRTRCRATKPAGLPLERAAIHFAEASRLLKGASLIDAVRFYAKHHSSNLPDKTVPEVLAELLEAKVASDLTFLSRAG